MIRALQAGFGDPLGVPLLKDLKALGIGMVRLDLQYVLTPEVAWSLIYEALGADLRPMLIIRPEQAPWLMLGAPGLDVEVLNEPDLAGWNPINYAHTFMNVYTQLQGRHQLWGGCVSNCTRKKLAWLEAVVLRLPQDAGVTLHRYPKNGARPADPQDGFRTRGDEFREILRVVGPHPFGVTEFGYHTGPQKTGWWFWTKRWRWTDSQVAVFALDEFRAWEEVGARFATWYQLNDGTTGDPIDRFGIRRTDGTWKPVSHTFAEGR